MDSSKTLIVIPARYASSRFPGKPLVDILGKSMIRRVYEQCSLLQGCEVIVATDDARIQEHVSGFGGKVEMTSGTHLSGTDRVGEVAARYPRFNYIINVQGDEPLIDPQQIALVEQQLEGGAEVATLIKLLEDPKILHSPNVVKAVWSLKKEVLYFSRSIIPYVRNYNESQKYYQHLGIYGFQREVLLKLVELPTSLLEKSEGLEQLRWLSNGFRIRAELSKWGSMAVDIPADLEKIIAHLKKLEDNAVGN
ncbi:MAG: 3-deoxy-manno-octulosonate cytidylyltransferase [Bacteroidia bacterium]|nr:3-deoxy-manno-octulosonate cytidylyltransferase [Bacteroidia bacterium]